jgi:hypothetical protein
MVGFRTGALIISTADEAVDVSSVEVTIAASPGIWYQESA